MTLKPLFKMHGVGCYNLRNLIVKVSIRIWKRAAVSGIVMKIQSSTTKNFTSATLSKF
jgi:hypothetical protein